jgi:adenylate cyclase
MAKAILMKIFTSIWMCIGLLALGLLIRIQDPDTVERVRLISFDSKINSIEQIQSDQIVLLNIGEKSLEKHGQWPWPRQHFAQMISDLRAANAGIIGITIMYPEADRFGGDEVFTSWVKDNGVVLSQVPSARGRSDVAPYVGTAVLGEGDPYDFAYKYNALVSNIKPLEDAAAGVGMVNSAVEVDNLVRRMPLITQVNNQLYPSFPMELIRVLQNKPSYSMHVEETGIIDLMIPPYEPIKTDYTGSIWINFSNQFQQMEYSDPLPDLQGKTVIVGVIAEGIQPILSTPAGPAYPHQIQASALQTIMNGDSITRPYWADLVEIALIVLGGLLIILAVYKLPALIGLGVFVFVGSSAIGFSAYEWTNSMYLLDWSFATFLFIIVFAQASFNNFYIQFKLRQQIKKQFGTYLSPDMVAMLQKDPSLLKLGGERKEMTFLFMDIVGFTPISEHYKNNDDPEGLVELVNEFLDKMTKIILANGGTIDKYMGDCIMAFWNAPLPCPNHAEMAVKSAIEIEEEINELKQEYEERALPDINVGTGVNTGTCIVGNMGSESRFDYSVIGDAVNLAARLEATAGRAEYLDYKTIISKDTYLQLPSGYVSHEIGTIKVKGKEEPITIYYPKKT